MLRCEQLIRLVGDGAPSEPAQCECAAAFRYKIPPPRGDGRVKAVCKNCSAHVLNSTAEMGVEVRFMPVDPELARVTAGDRFWIIRALRFRAEQFPIEAPMLRKLALLFESEYLVSILFDPNYGAHQRAVDAWENEGGAVH